MLRNSASGPETELPGWMSAGFKSAEFQNLPSGRPSAFEAFPIRIRPKSGPEGRFPARKHCLQSSTDGRVAGRASGGQTAGRLGSPAHTFNRNQPEWPVFGQFLASCWTVVGQFVASFWPVFGQCLASFWPVFGQVFGQFLATTNLRLEYNIKL